jgi:2-C-methyl-D-erythritol 4-phosphate cytidylyltransferase
MSPSFGSASLPDVGVLIAAAGRGERAGAGDPKQFRAIRGVPMLLRGIRPFARNPRVREIVVALPGDRVEHPPEWLGAIVGDRLRLAAGGATRAESVRAALDALDPACTIVLVHDAARPFVSPEIVDSVIDAAAAGVGALPGVPVADTLKRTAGPPGAVLETVARSGLWRAQTPQGFPRTMIEEAYRRSGETAGTYTDDASLVEAAGFPVKVVPGSDRNFKVTTDADFRLAELVAEP